MTARPILFIDHAAALGGAEHSLLLILKHLDRARWQPHLACGEGALAERAQKLGVTVHPVKMPRLRRSIKSPSRWFRDARKLANIAHDIDAVLIHSNTIRSTFYAALAARLARRHFVWHVRDLWLSETPPRYSFVDAALKRLLCASTSRIIANSQVSAANVPCPSRVQVIHNGIDIEQYGNNSDCAVFRAKYGIPADAKIVGMVGRMRPIKGQDVFVRLAKSILASYKNVYFLMVGGDLFEIGDGYSAYVHRLVEELGLESKMMFTGHLDDVRPALNALDVFVSPGDPETFGLVNVEAMAMAKPVVAFAHGALPEIVIEGETGTLIPPDDEPGLAQAIIRMLDEPERAVEMGKAGRERVEQHFTIKQTVRSIEQVYERILSGQG